MPGAAVMSTSGSIVNRQDAIEYIAKVALRYDTAYTELVRLADHWGVPVSYRDTAEDIAAYLCEYVDAVYDYANGGHIDTVLCRAE
jgi:hypothetical protein